MKKTFLFTLSITLAFGITFYIKKEQSKKLVRISPEWKTFVKSSNETVASHHTTSEEFQAARIVTPLTNKAPDKIVPDRTIANVNSYQGVLVRDNRILMGDVTDEHEDESSDLKMVNSINPKWKEIMGNELMRFQPEDTKLLVKEEVPVIKIQEGLGRYLEQVTITYLQKDGKRNSFRALVDSESGAVVQTWDRTIHEEIKRTRGGSITLPSNQDNGIITR